MPGLTGTEQILMERDTSKEIYTLMQGREILKLGETHFRVLGQARVAAHPPGYHQ